MDVKEKLVELLYDAMFFEGYGRELCEKQADHLIANGVVVQECGRWEDDHGDYVCSCCHTAFTDEIVWIVRGESNEPNYCPHCGAKMMPQPPKGE
jgi:DNA-directed RNA polymerase subunit RPC12/RpoP